MLQAPRTVPVLDVVCVGTPYEMGRAQGAALRKKIQGGRRDLKLLEAFRNEQPRWMPYPLFLSYAERKVAALIGPEITSAFPQMCERIRGIAEGAGISLKALFLLDGFEALMASVEGRFDVAPPRGACSAIALRGHRATDGQPIVARNFDYLPIVQPFYALRESRPAHGIRSLEFTMAPMAGAVDGVNEAGLCITYNYAFTLDKPQREFGLISMAISEALARCRSVTEAAEWIASRPRWGGGILMLADASGDIASLELSSTSSHLRRPVENEDLIYHTNCFAEGNMCAVQVPAGAYFSDCAPRPLRGRRVLQSADSRRDRLQQLLAPHNVLGRDELQTILSDHGSTGQPGDDSLCMHGSYWTTTASLQWFPVRRSVRVAYSSTCQAEYVEMQLS